MHIPPKGPILGRVRKGSCYRGWLGTKGIGKQIAEVLLCERLCRSYELAFKAQLLQILIPGPIGNEITKSCIDVRCSTDDDDQSDTHDKGSRQ